MNLTKKLLLSVLTTGLLGFTSVFAGGIDHFNVTLDPADAKVGEALDLTIQAMDKNNTIVTDYRGTVLIFSESDPEAELPNGVSENTYTFSSTDQGSVKFENGLKFKTSGLQDIHIYDFDDDTVIGVAESSITADSKAAKIDIEIISPEDGLIIGTDSINISGTTQKNHKVNIIINDSRIETTTSNNEGLFEKRIEGLENGAVSFKTQVFNADEEVVGESETVNIKIESHTPKLKNIKLIPNEVDSEGIYTVEIIANSGLSEVNIVVNDSLIKIPETEVGGVYTKEIYAPKQAGVYKIDVNLKDELGHETKEIGAESLTVNEVVLEAAESTNTGATVEATGIETVDEVIELDAATSEKKELKVTGIKLVELKTKSVLTWDKTEGAESYNVYKKGDNGDLELIENTPNEKFEVEIDQEVKEKQYDYFAVKAVAKTSSGEIYEGNLSEATKIQTGPEMIILLILSLLIGGFVFIAHQKKA